jgi:hypothetical protein
MRAEVRSAVLYDPGTRSRMIDASRAQSNPRDVWENCLRIKENPVVPALYRWFNNIRLVAKERATFAVRRSTLRLVSLFRMEGDREMRKLLTLVAVGILCSGIGFLRADEKGKTITIKGDGMCAKCGLKDKDAKKCQNVVIVTKDGKMSTYYLESNKYFGESHKALGFCTASKDEPVKVEVTGTCEKKDDKLVLTPTEKIKKVED